MSTEIKENETLAISFDDSLLFGYKNSECDESLQILSTTLSHYDNLYIVPSELDKAKHEYLSQHINRSKSIQLATQVDDLSSAILPNDKTSLPNKLISTRRIQFFSGLFSDLKTKAEGLSVRAHSKAIISLPSQLALLNSEVRDSEKPSTFSSWDDTLFVDVEKAAGIAGFSEVVAVGGAIPIVKNCFDGAEKMVNGQFTFVVEVTKSGFILSPVGQEDMSYGKQCPKKLTKDCMFIPFDIRDWLRIQLDAMPKEMKTQPYFKLVDEAHKKHYIDMLLTRQDIRAEDSIPMGTVAPMLLSSLKDALRKKLRIPQGENIKVSQVRQRDLNEYENLFTDDEKYREYFNQFCDEVGHLHEEFVPYIIVTGTMAGNSLLAPVFEDAFTSLFKKPGNKEASRCVSVTFDTVTKAVKNFVEANPSFKYSPGYEVFDQVSASFPQSTKEQKIPVLLKKKERPLLIRRLVPDVSPDGSKLTLKLSCLGRSAQVEGVFDFCLEKWHVGYRVEAELIVEKGDRVILRTYLDGKPFEVQLPEKDKFEFDIARESPGVYEFFSSVEHKIHWEKMNNDTALA